MAINRLVTSQYRNIVDRAAAQAANLTVPPEGWLCTARKALKMSGAQLARHLKQTRAQVLKTEKAEVNGNVTLKTLQNMAEAMGCRFVYAMVPEGSIDDLLMKQARKKAWAIVNAANSHMALEAQTLSNEQITFEVERLVHDMLERPPRDFWDDK